MAGLVAGVLTAVIAQGAQQPPAPVVTFKAGVDLVRISAVVRDRKGRFVPDLTARDFEVLDAGRPQPIADFRPDLAGVSAALLFDVSGSMEARLPGAREAAGQVLSWLTSERDEAAVFTFDTRLDEAVPFTSGLRVLPSSLSSVVPFGATSLFDAIAATARKVAARQGRRRAVVVLTDGNDNASRLTPSEVSGLASAVDVPVYVIATVPPIDNPADDIAVSGRAVAADRAAGGFRGVDRRPRVRGEHAGGAQRGGAADRGRAAGISICWRSSRRARPAGIRWSCARGGRIWSCGPGADISPGNLARIHVDRRRIESCGKSSSASRSRSWR